MGYFLFFTPIFYGLRINVNCQPAIIYNRVIIKETTHDPRIVNPIKTTNINLPQINTLHPEHKLENKTQRYQPLLSVDIKYALYNLFEAYGQILQIVVKRNNKMRGQAFVVFKEVAEATAAKNNLSGYPIFGKPMVHFGLF